MHRDGRNPKFNFWSIIVLIEVISAELNALAPENVFFMLFWPKNVSRAQKLTFSDVSTHYAMSNPL